MGYWKSKVLPKIKKVFDKGGKNAAAAEAAKAFDASKDEISKEFEEKKAELQPRVLEIYEASPAEIKAVVKERKLSGLKKNSVAASAFLEQLAKIEFPGAKQASEASAQFGPALVSGAAFFVFEKVATFVPVEAPAAEATKVPEEEKEEEDVKKEAKKEDKKDEVKEEEEPAAPAALASEEAVAAPAPPPPAADIAAEAPAQETVKPSLI